MSPRYTLLRWLPAVVVMVTIFAFSSLPAARIPFFGAIDVLVKKSGHALGYALLGLAYYYALPPRRSAGFRWLVAISMAILFALSDEYHQSFVEGRTSTLRDVAIDTAGAAVSVTLGALYSSNSSSKSDA